MPLDIQSEQKIITDLVNARHSRLGKLTPEQFISGYSGGYKVRGSDLTAYSIITGNHDRNPLLGNKSHDATAEEMLSSGHPGDRDWLVFDKAGQMRLVSGEVILQKIPEVFPHSREVKSVLEVLPPLWNATGNFRNPVGQAFRSRYQLLCTPSEADIAFDAAGGAGSQLIPDSEMALVRKYQRFMDTQQVASGRALVRLLDEYEGFRGESPENAEICAAADAYFTGQLNAPTRKLIPNAAYAEFVEKHGGSIPPVQINGKNNPEYDKFRKQHGTFPPIHVADDKGKKCINPEWVEFMDSNFYRVPATIENTKKEKVVNPLYKEMEDAGLIPAKVIGKLPNPDFEDWLKQHSIEVPAHIEANHAGVAAFSKIPVAEQRDAPKPAAWIVNPRYTQFEVNNAQLPSEFIDDPVVAAKYQRYMTDLEQKELPEELPDALVNGARYDHYIRHRGMDTDVSENFAFGAVTGGDMTKCLLGALKDQGFAGRELVSLGLLKDPQSNRLTRGNSLYIPYFDSFGLVSGSTNRQVIPTSYSGRSVAKYLGNNSPVLFSDAGEEVQLPDPRKVSRFNSADSMSVSKQHLRAESVTVEGDKFVIEGGKPPKPFGADSLAKCKGFAIYEGELDGISSHILGLPAEAVSGVNHLNQVLANTLAQRLPFDAVIYAMGDNDASNVGQHAAKEFLAYFPHRVTGLLENPYADTAKVGLSKGKDPNDLLVQKGVKLGSALIRDAIEGAADIHERLLDTVTPARLDNKERLAREVLTFAVRTIDRGDRCSRDNAFSEFFDRKANALTICAGMQFDSGWDGHDPVGAMQKMSGVMRDVSDLANGTQTPKRNATVAAYAGSLFHDIKRELKFQLEDDQAHGFSIFSNVSEDRLPFVKERLNTTLRDSINGSPRLLQAVEQAALADDYRLAIKDAQAVEGFKESMQI